MGLFEKMSGMPQGQLTVNLSEVVKRVHALGTYKVTEFPDSFKVDADDKADMQALARATMGRELKSAQVKAIRNDVDLYSDALEELECFIGDGSFSQIIGAAHFYGSEEEVNQWVGDALDDLKNQLVGKEAEDGDLKETLTPVRARLL